MYSSKKIPAPFNGTHQKATLVPHPVPVKAPSAAEMAAPLETTEAKTQKSTRNSASPLLALLFLELFSDTKKE